MVCEWWGRRCTCTCYTRSTVKVRTFLLKHGFGLEFKLALGQNQGVGWDVRVED